MNQVRVPQPARPTTWAQALAVIAALTAIAVHAEQPAADPQPGIERLLQMLEQRDAVIEALRRRVEVLESKAGSGPDHIGANPPSAAPVASAKAPAAGPAAAAPSATTSDPAAAGPTTTPSDGAAARTARSAGAPTAVGAFDVDVDAAERALERTLVVTGALLLPVGQVDLTTAFGYTRTEDAAPTVFTAQGLQYLATHRLRRDLLSADLSVRLGLPYDTQLELGIPYRYARQQAITEVAFSPRGEASTSATGVGDLRVGLAKGLLHERSWWPDLIARIDWDTGFGKDEANGVSLGGGFNEVQASLTMTKRQDPLVFVGSAAYETTLKKGEVKPGDRIGLSFGALLAASPETSLRVTFNQSFINATKIGERSVAGTDRLSAMLSFGASSIVGHGKFVDVSAGVGLTGDAPDFSLGLSFSYRFDAAAHR